MSDEILIVDQPIGSLEHKPTHSSIAVYHKINWFRRIMLKLCFDLDYKSYE